MAKMGFSYVYIPQDETQLIEERKHEAEATLENDTFIEALKKHFGKGMEKPDPEMLKQQMMQHAGAEQAAEAMKKLDDQTIAKLLNMTTVDIFPVLLPVEKTKFNGISIYVDDKGQSKKLPLNRRATDLAQRCGYVDTCFFGDAFIARIFDDQDAWERIDFKMSDCNSDAEWVKQVQEQREKKTSPGALSDFKSMVAGKGGPQVMGPMGPAAAKDVSNSQRQGPTEVTTEIYTMKENGDEVEITLKEEVKSKKDVKVVFAKQNLSVVIAGKAVWEKLELAGPIDNEDSSWSILDGKFLQITLMKRDGSTKVWSTLEKK